MSGALAGAAGCLTALPYEGLPSPLEFSPTAAVAYLAIPLVGGTWLVAAGAVVQRPEGLAGWMRQSAGAALLGRLRSR